MNKDIVQECRRVFSELPLPLLQEMRRNLENKKNTGEAMHAIIFDLSVEILRRKWGAGNGKGC